MKQVTSCLLVLVPPRPHTPPLALPKAPLAHLSCCLFRTQFKHDSMLDCVLDNAVLVQCGFKNSILSRCQCISAEFQGAVLQSTIIRDCDLRRRCAVACSCKVGWGRMVSDTIK